MIEQLPFLFNPSTCPTRVCLGTFGVGANYRSGQVSGGASAMVTLRNPARPPGSLEERLLKFAKEAREAAKFIAPGPEQDLLLRKALKAETLASASDRLA